MPEIKVSISNGTPIFNPDPLPVPEVGTVITWVKDPPDAAFKFKDIKHLPKKPFSSQNVTSNAIVAIYDGDKVKTVWSYTVSVESTGTGSDMFGDGSGTIRNH